MNPIKKVLYSICQWKRKNALKECGKHVHVARHCNLMGNIYVAHHVSIGESCRFVSTIANIYIGDYVVFGPEVTIYSGDHRFDIIGRYISDITDADKLPNNDCDVVIDSDVWIGTRAIILKGVHIGKGCIIGAGAVVTKDVPPYTIYVGSPGVQMIKRFNEEQIQSHENIIKTAGTI